MVSAAAVADQSAVIITGQQGLGARAYVEGVAPALAASREKNQKNSYTRTIVGRSVVKVSDTMVGIIEDSCT